MELKGEQTLPLPREQVWAALNDPAILQQCVPGCESFDPVGDNEYKVVMTAAVGPVKAKFNGALTLSDIQPPSSYRLAFTGSGGAAGFGKGSAQVDLESVTGGTTLRYGVNAQVGGKLAQVGARLIDGVAKKMADEFFNRFSKVLAAAAPAGNPAGVDTASHSTPLGGTQAAPAGDGAMPYAAAQSAASGAGAASSIAGQASTQPATEPVAGARHAAAPGLPPAAAAPNAARSVISSPVLAEPGAGMAAVPAARWVWPAIGVLAVLVIYLLMRP